MVVVQQIFAVTLEHVEHPEKARIILVVRNRIGKVRAGTAGHRVPAQHERSEVFVEKLLLVVQLAVTVIALDIRVVVAIGVGARLALVFRQAIPPLPVDDVLACCLKRRKVNTVPAARVGQVLAVGFVLEAEIRAQMQPALAICGNEAIEDFRVVIGFAERGGALLVVRLPERFLRVAQIQRNAEQALLETDLEQHLGFLAVIFLAVGCRQQEHRLVQRQSRTCADHRIGVRISFERAALALHARRHRIAAGNRSRCGGRRAGYVRYDRRRRGDRGARFGYGCGRVARQRHFGGGRRRLRIRRTCWLTRARIGGCYRCHVGLCLRFRAEQKRKPTG